MSRRIEVGDLAHSTYSLIVKVLHRILKWAKGRGYTAIDSIPDLALKNRQERKEAMFLERDQIADLLRAVQGQPEENAIIHCGLLLGLRRGEILGLKWSDVDTEERRVHVRRSVRKRYVGSPKTKNSRRAVDAPDAALRALAAYRESRPGENGDFIFRRDDGMRLHPETWYKRVFPKIRERAGLPSTFKMHSLRYTYASLLIFQGENIKYVSRQLGHGSIAITGDTYAHILSENTTSAMKKLDAAIGDIRRDMIRVVG